MSDITAQTFAWDFYGHRVSLEVVELGEHSGRVRINFGHTSRERCLPYEDVGQCLKHPEATAADIDLGLKLAAYAVWVAELLEIHTALEDYTDEKIAAEVEEARAAAEGMPPAQALQIAITELQRRMEAAPEEGGGTLWQAYETLSRLHTAETTAEAQAAQSLARLFEQEGGQ